MRFAQYNSWFRTAGYSALLSFIKPWGDMDGAIDFAHTYCMGGEL